MERARILAGHVLALARDAGVVLPDLPLLSAWGPPIAAPAHPSDPDALSRADEALLGRSGRRAGGVFHTPWAVASLVAARLIDRPGVVCDPAVGTGTFLVAAGEALVGLGLSRAAAARLLVGVDVDPVAAAVAEARVAVWSGGVAPRVVAADALEMGEAWPARPDFVIGNPPYVEGRHVAFLALAARLVQPDGAVALVLPESVLATQEGRMARDAVAGAGLRVASVERLGSVFDASVQTCVVELRPGFGDGDDIAATWSSWLADGVPDVALSQRHGLVGDECEVVAGFRQHFYGLRGHVREGGDGLPLVTSGAIEPGTWGGRPVRFDGRRFDDPRVQLDDVAEPVRSWFRALLRPKLVLATQTRVLEAAADPRGEVVPGVPVISVVPADPHRLWHLLAVLLSPPVTAWAVRRWGGAALSSNALKLGVGQVRDVPLPPVSRWWDDAAAALRDGGSGAVDSAAASMCRAYGVGEEVRSWWTARRR